MTNRFNGKAWEQAAAKQVEAAYPASQGYQVVVGGKGVWTPGGYRYPDITVRDALGKPVRYFEAKHGNAKVSAAQSAKDHWIHQNTGVPTIYLRSP